MTVLVTDAIRIRWRGMRDMFLRYEAMLTESGHADKALIEACQVLAAAFETAPLNPSVLEQPSLASKWDKLRAFISTPSVLH